MVGRLMVLGHASIISSKDDDKAFQPLALDISDLPTMFLVTVSCFLGKGNFQSSHSLSAFISVTNKPKDL